MTSFQHSFIVSDQGTAAIWGHDASEQAEQIITQVAHPRVRGELRQAGRALGFRVSGGRRSGRTGTFISAPGRRTGVCSGS